MADLESQGGCDEVGKGVSLQQDGGNLGADLVAHA